MLFLNFFVLLVICAVSVSAYEATFNLDTAQRYVALTGVAYCTNPSFGKDTVETWTCSACKKFPHVNATSFHGSITDANGFIAIDHDANEIVISFSGTNPLSIQNWIDDLNFIQTSYPLCTDCKVHEGFYQTYNSVASKVISLLDQYKASYPTATLAITGHSLGAAMAAHCAADLAARGYKFKTPYTFGMPRVGNDKFQNWYKNSGLIPGTYRVVHDKDPVPHLAPENWGFHHMPYEVFYEYSYKNWQLCNFDGEDNKCSDKYLLDANVVYHVNYLDFDFTTNWLSCEL